MGTRYRKLEYFVYRLVPFALTYDAPNVANTTCYNLGIACLTQWLTFLLPHPWLLLQSSIGALGTCASISAKEKLGIDKLASPVLTILARGTLNSIVPVFVEPDLAVHA
jgi:hypothetical protein